MKQKTILKFLFILCNFLILFSNNYGYGSLFSFDSLKNITRASKEEVSLSGIDIKQLRYLLSNVIADHEKVANEQVPEVLVKCYERLHSGNETLYLDELLEMFPMLVDYVAKDMIIVAKAPRLDAPLVTASNAIVGKDGCDLTPVLALLSIIKKRVINLPKIICDKIEMLEEIICDKFEQTWTILDDIENDISGVFTVLDNLVFSATLICDLSGIFTVLAEIDDDIFDTQTILCDKFEQTWTILQEIEDDIFDTQTILCDKFEQTWTILQEIDDDIFDTQTILCDKFEQTWTILDDIENDLSGVFTVLDNLTVSATCDLSGVFTVLAEIDEDIFDTQTILCDKFEQTWTILQDIQDDINDGNDDIIDDIIDTQTILCQKFFETWTILADIEDDISGVFTVLDNLSFSVTAVCDLSGVFTVLNEIDEDVIDTQTILCQKFFETWTILADIEDDISGVFTVLNNLSISVTAFCDLSGVFTVLDNLVVTATVDLSTIEAALCSPIPITQADVGATTFTISSPGFYVFAEDITFSPASGQPAIEITSDNVKVDLCCKTLSQGNATSGVDGFRIQGGASGTPRSNVTIMNGAVKDFTRAGVVVGTNSVTPADTAAEMIALKSLTVVGCELRGIEFPAASAAAAIKKSVVEGCKVLCCCTDASADYGLYFANTKDIKVRDCVLNENGGASVGLTVVNIETSTKIILTAVDANCNEGLTVTGFRLDTSEGCLLNGCRVLTNNATSSLTGYVLTGNSAVQGNILDGCLASNNNSTNGPLSGFELLPFVTRNTLNECIASNNLVTGAVASANCFGFNFDQVTFCNVTECRAVNNRSTGNGTTNIAAGYNFSTSGVSGTGNKSCEFFWNFAITNNGFDDDRSYGFRLVSDANGNEDNAFMASLAVRNGPSSPLVHRQITRTSGTGSSPGGIPAASLCDRTISTLGSGTDFSLCNFRIT